MAESQRFEVVITREARGDAFTIVSRSVEEFGESAAQRYAEFIKQAIRDIGDEPERAGSKRRAEPGLEGWHIAIIWNSAGRVLGAE